MKSASFTRFFFRSILLVLLVAALCLPVVPAAAQAVDPPIVESMDLTSFVKPAVAGVPLVFVIIGFVYWFKEFRRKDGTPLFSGNILLLVSMVWGLLLGGGYMISVTRPPTADAWVIYVYWFGVFIYGIAMGIVASGLYSAVKTIIEKQFTALFKPADLDTTEDDYTDRLRSIVEADGQDPH